MKQSLIPGSDVPSRCTLPQDQMYPPDRIVEMASLCDYIVVSTPYTPATHGIVSESTIGAMKTNAVLVNVGRGKCVDER